jgi:two-component system sensor histidine kinase QseC
MGDRTLEARLTRRLLPLAGAVLVAVGAAAVLVTDRVLDASDETRARAAAGEARDALARELAEGDAPDEALGEVMVAANAQAVRLTVRRASGEARSAGSPLPELTPGSCAPLEDLGSPWRACAVDAAGARVVAAVPTAAHAEAVRTLARGMVAVVLVALFALWVAVRQALRAPIAELTALVGWSARIVESGRPVEPPAAATREVAHLETAFDTLVRRLFDALTRERATSAHMAHELRTPLTAMRAELDALKPTDEPTRAAIVRLGADVVRLAAVIDAILVLSDAAPRSAADAVVNVADLVRELAPEGARVEAPEEALVEADERLVTLALTNLLDNARKYGEGVRAVSVSREPAARAGGADAADAANAAVRVSVVDAGPGVDEAARGKMFDRYWRGSADAEGSGLGLALVRAVAERHGGKAEARPGPEGRGLDVSMTLGHVVGWHG